MVRVCLAPSGSTLLNFIWLPRCDATSNPKEARVFTTSAPDTTLGFGMRLRFGFQFVTRQDRRVRCEAKIGRILAFQLKCNRFLHVLHQLVQRRRLGNHRQIEAFCDEIFFPAKNADLYDSLHICIIAKFFVGGQYASSKLGLLLLIPPVTILASPLLPEHLAAAPRTDSPSSP